MTDQLTRSQELIARRKAAVPNGVGMFNYATAAKASTIPIRRSSRRIGASCTNGD